MGVARKKSYGLIMAVYLLGIFMGAIDTGIVSPVRTIIQSSLGVDGNTGIWMITIYTLAYAASIPVMGKLADKYGRKVIYLISILLFGAGSLFCGLSQMFGSFSVMLTARVIQAIGGGGIIPVATAEFGTTFPKEKRGMALGLVGGVYGIANIFGSSAGSLILDIFGSDNWKYIFFVNLPISVFIIIAGIVCLPNTKTENVKKIDILGIMSLTIMVLSILYGLKNIDFFDFANSISGTDVYPFLIIFVIIMPLFILAEKKAEDPVMNLAFFKNLRINITLIISFITGVAMMGIIFVPQFCENCMNMVSGSGGYFVIALGVFAGLGAPVSGKLIDKYGVRLVLAIGFISSIAGALFLNFVTIPHSNYITVFAGLILMGIGIGFTMGTPLNYMMLSNTKEEESNSALATVSLVRSIGTAIAPAIMIGFISHAGMNVGTQVMNIMPEDVNMPEIKYVDELSEEISVIQENKAIMAMMGDVDLSKMDIKKMLDMKIDMSNTSGDFTMPQELTTLMQSSDVTTITDNAKTMASYMFDNILPKAVGGIQEGISSLEKVSASMSSMMGSMKGGQGAGMPSMDAGAMADGKGAMPEGMPGIDAGAMADGKAAMPEGMPGMDAGAMAGDKGVMPEGMPGKDAGAMADGKAAMPEGMPGIDMSKMGNMPDINTMLEQMKSIRDEMPSAFEKAKANYLSQIDGLDADIRATFKDTLNVGFRQVYTTVIVASLIALLLLAFYREKERKAKANINSTAAGK